MNLKKIKEILFETFFKTQYWEIQVLHSEVLNQKEKQKRLLNEKLELAEKFRSEVKAIREDLEKIKNRPKPTLADMMNEVLGVNVLDFTNVQADGFPNHFLNTDDETKRMLYIAQLHEIWGLEVWKAMCDYHINLQANFLVRQADGDLQVNTGRMTINGISLLKKEVNTGHTEYLERSKPPEDFDKFSVELLNERD